MLAREFFFFYVSRMNFQESKSREPRELVNMKNMAACISVRELTHK